MGGAAQTCSIAMLSEKDPARSSVLMQLYRPHCEQEPFFQTSMANQDQSTYTNIHDHSTTNINQKVEPPLPQKPVRRSSFLPGSSVISRQDRSTSSSSRRGRGANIQRKVGEDRVPELDDVGQGEFLGEEAGEPAERKIGWVDSF